MDEKEVFELADLILGEKYNRANVKTLADAIFAAGIKRGAQMMRAANNRCTCAIGHIHAEDCPAYTEE
jgi:hypothetical protein